jgi:hypothetical protein
MWSNVSEEPLASVFKVEDKQFGIFKHGEPPASLSRIRGYHSGGYKDFNFMGCNNIRYKSTDVSEEHDNSILIVE